MNLELEPEETSLLIPEEPHQLHRRLRSRHLQMIAIGGTIGTGLFIGAGGAIATAGPLGSLLVFALVGMMVYSIVTSLGELACFMPISGSFCTYAGLFVDPGIRFDAIFISYCII